MGEFVSFPRRWGDLRCAGDDETIRKGKDPFDYHLPFTMMQ